MGTKPLSAPQPEGMWPQTLAPPSSQPLLLLPPGKIPGSWQKWEKCLRGPSGVRAEGFAIGQELCGGWPHPEGGVTGKLRV